MDRPAHAPDRHQQHLLRHGLSGRLAGVHGHRRCEAGDHPDRFYYAAGGNTLNSLIQQSPVSGPVPAGLIQEFDRTAQELIAAGDVVAFGEVTALHVSYEPRHSFEETPANGGLFKRLADLAASRDVPIDFHMDAVEQTMATPEFFLKASGNNPPRLQANIAAFEELLAYNRNARIVWAHVGRDTTGAMTPTLVRRLLQAHSNLYIQIAPQLGPLGTSNSIVDDLGVVRPDWTILLLEFPDRAVLGSDTFHTGERERAMEDCQRFLQQLPSDLARKIGCENPGRIYKLGGGC
ncbi:MAG: amidohydrolase family protein [Candidatus Riflebacteria bacterium]|nr:amidohydrolase family protein [Candidatus Riflebacteria bacterium]